MEVLKPMAKLILKEMAKRFFSEEELCLALGINPVSVRRTLERLCREGIVTQIKKYPPWARLDGKPRRHRKCLQITYRLADKDRLALRIAPKLRESSAAERMWKVIRFKKIFNRRDLIVLAGAEKENAKWYIKMLRRAGIIRALEKRGPRMDWILIKDTAKRPAVSRKKEGV